MESKNFLFSLIAMFLALGIGILVGASMGEEALVMNQIIVIEKLKEEILHHKEEVEQYIFLTSRLQEDLERWESLEDGYLEPLLIEDRLQEAPIRVLTQDKLPNEVKQFLRLSGSPYTIYHFAALDSWRETCFLELFEMGLQCDPVPDSEAFLLNELGKILQDDQPIFDNKIAEFLKSRKLLGIEETGQAQFLPAIAAENGNKKLFVVVGNADPFLQSIIERIMAEGAVVIHLLDDDEEDENVWEAIGKVEPTYVINDFHKFFNRLELLEIIEEINGKS